MPSLQQTMIRFIRVWRADLPPQWVRWLGQLAPNPNHINPALTIAQGTPVLPGRRMNPLQNSPPNSHVFRAFDGISPVDVRVVFLGQDPYPRVNRATGRAFEQGDLRAWSQTNPSATSSVRRIAQEAASVRSGNQNYRMRRGGWTRLKNAIHQGNLIFPTPQVLFNSWERQGILFLNTALTVTQPGRNSHISMWTPFTMGICKKLAIQRSPVVFVALGCQAWKSLKGAGIITNQSRPSLRTYNTVFRFHPAGHRFFGTSNLCDEINQKLHTLNGGQIRW